MTDKRPLLDMSQIPPRWRGGVVFGVVSLVLGLVGILIALGVDPPPRAIGTTTTTTATTTSLGATTSTSGAGTTSTTATGGTSTTVAGAAPLQVSTDTLDFGADGTSGEFVIGNTGDAPGDWTLTASSDALVVSLGSGTLAPGESVTIEVTLDRGLLATEGEIAETLTVSWAGGEAVIAAVGTHEANPIIHNPRANPAEVRVDAGCGSTHTTVSARVRDTSPLESVVVRWSPDGSAETETAMNPIGDDVYEAVIGPFRTVHTAEVRVVAFDERGNAGGAAITVPVLACP